MVFKAFRSSANRSHASLLSQDQRSHDPSPTDTPLQSPEIQQQQQQQQQRAGPPPSQLSQQEPSSLAYEDHDAQGQQQQYHQQHPDEAEYHPEQLQQLQHQHQHQQDPHQQLEDSHLPHPHINQLLRRSQSQRQHYFTGPQPTANLIGTDPIIEAETIEEDERQKQAYSQAQPTAAPSVGEPPKKSKRRFFGLGHSQSSSAEGGRPVLSKPGPSHLQPGASQGNTGLPARKVSLRRKEQSQSVRVIKQPTQDQTSASQYPYSSAQSSVSQLHQAESDEGSGLDPFLVQPPQTGSPVTPQEFQEYQNQSGQSRYSTHDGHQFQHTLQRRGTDPGHLNLSPADQEFVQHPSQTQFDQSMHPSTLQAQDAGGYQAYRPNSSGSSSNLPSDLANHYQQDNGQPHRTLSQNYSTPGYQAYNPPSGGPNQRPPIQAQPPPQAGTGNMPPPVAAEGKGRRSIETNPSAGPGPPREGSNLGNYGPGGQSSNGPPGPSTTVYPPPNSGNNTASQYRGGPPQQQQQQPGGNQEHGRSTPPIVTRSGSGDPSTDLAQVIHERDTLQGKYSKVKKLYFEKNSQVEQLQNTLAHQRLSQSRTALDDNEYTQRFNRLDGAINNLAFNIRKDWKSIPAWLQPCVNQDAHTKVTKEMTAVGRAAISRWIVEEVLECYFHPGLDPAFSSGLKIIEKGIRRMAPPTNNIEEEDALLAKISNWRLATIDGLQDSLFSPQAMENRANLTHSLVEKLVSDLESKLVDPAPAGLSGSVSMIIELAIGIAANLPLESRDVCVEYFMPGTPVSPDYMKLETGLPPLTNPGTGSEGIETGSNDTDSQLSGETKEGDADSVSVKDQLGSKKKAMFGGAKAGKKGPGQGLDTAQKPSAAASQSSLSQDAQRVRMAGFMAVEVRGRSILVKAPVWT